MAWDEAVVTFQGVKLLDRFLDGERFHLDNAAGGTGTVAPAALMAQTALKAQKQRFDIVGVKDDEDGKKINIQIVSQGLAAGYLMQQAGVFAHVEDEPPILFAILQDSAGISIPSKDDIPDFAMNFYVKIPISGDAKFTFTFNPSALVTAGLLNDSITAAVEVKQDKITASGLLKGDGQGGVSSAGIKDISYNGKPLDEVIGDMSQGVGDLKTHVSDKNNPHGVTKSQVGLGNVDNTTDVNKPVSTKQQAAIDAHANKKDNPHGVTKSQVGLDKVDNTSDLDKPVSTVQKTYIDAGDIPNFWFGDCNSLAGDVEKKVTGVVGSKTYKQIHGSQVYLYFKNGSTVASGMSLAVCNEPAAPVVLSNRGNDQAFPIGDILFTYATNGSTKIWFGVVMCKHNSTSTTITATASGWNETTKQQNITVTGLTANTVGTLGLAITATDEEYDAATIARIRITEQTTNSITLKCLGTIPSINIPLVVNF